MDKLELLTDFLIGTLLEPILPESLFGVIQSNLRIYPLYLIWVMPAKETKRETKGFGFNTKPLFSVSGMHISYRVKVPNTLYSKEY